MLVGCRSSREFWIFLGGDRPGAFRFSFRFSPAVELGPLFRDILLLPERLISGKLSRESRGAISDSTDRM
jgi:hypothetical protein